MRKHLKVKLLKALYGDCILIKFYGNDRGNHNIFIDSGFVKTYLNTLKLETEKIIEANEKIDLFVITHIDQDHIGGISTFIKDFKNTDLVDEFWFNAGGYKLYLNNNNKISYRQGIELRDYLIESNNLSVDNQIVFGVENYNLYGVKIKILSPFVKDLKQFRDKWEEEEKDLYNKISIRKSDWNESIKKLSQNDFVEDNSLSNKVSISFIFEYYGIIMLFLADSHPSTIIEALKQRGYTEMNKLKVDFVKLAHHASKFNTNYKLLKLIDTDTFLISGNAKNQFYLPHKETLAKILTHPARDYSKKINFIFNYSNYELKNMFNDSDYKKYNFECYYPKEGSNGYVINF